MGNKISIALSVLHLKYGSVSILTINQYLYPSKAINRESNESCSPALFVKP